MTTESPQTTLGDLTVVKKTLNIVLRSDGGFFIDPRRAWLREGGSKEERKQAKGGLKRVQVQHASWRKPPPPSMPPYLSGQVREAQQRVPPSTHLQLLQFPEAAEDLRDSLQTEVKSRKAETGQLKSTSFTFMIF
jgi:hypothetical protein